MRFKNANKGNNQIKLWIERRIVEVQRASGNLILKLHRRVKAAPILMSRDTDWRRANSGTV